ARGRAGGARAASRPGCGPGWTAWAAPPRPSNRRRASIRAGANGRAPGSGRPARGPRRGAHGRDASTPVVKDEVGGVFVILLPAPLHPDHREIDLVSALDEGVVREPVPSMTGD